jgi:pyruvate dehydrogenase E2 component (dihydrolipoamide acetyltransferase)
MPKLGLTMSEGVLTSWLAENGAAISKGQPLFEIETDKMTSEASAEAAGILHVVAEAGETVAVLKVVAYLLAPGEQPPEPAHQPAVAVSSPPAKNLSAAQIEKPDRPAGPSPASPAAKRRARELGVDIARVEPGGDDGRITVADVEAFASRGPAAVAMTSVRKRIAERMRASVSQTAAVTLTSEVDATEIVRLRRERAVSFDSMLAAIAARALQEFPDINSQLDGESVRQITEISIGVAVDTPRGLLVPVVRDVPGKSLAEVDRQLQELAQRAVDGKSQPGDLEGATFTITNLGMLGVDAFTPIINLPQVAILGVGRVQRKPVAWQDRIELRDRMVLSLTFDHRPVDGAPAARFLRRIAELVEGPSWLESKTA